jgi:hypothetical protein
MGRYIHGKGLKYGIYSDAGKLTCAKYPGSWGHEAQDAATFAQWGALTCRHARNCVGGWGVGGGQQGAHTAVQQGA